MQIQIQMQMQMQIQIGELQIHPQRVSSVAKAFEGLSEEQGVNLLLISWQRGLGLIINSHRRRGCFIVSSFTGKIQTQMQIQIHIQIQR